jgi:hypothetical protein
MKGEENSAQDTWFDEKTDERNAENSARVPRWLPWLKANVSFSD